MRHRAVTGIPQHRAILLAGFQHGKQIAALFPFLQGFVDKFQCRCDLDVSEFSRGDQHLFDGESIAGFQRADANLVVRVPIERLGGHHLSPPVS
jgi:hypothetical protein